MPFLNFKERLFKMFFDLSIRAFYIIISLPMISIILGEIKLTIKSHQLYTKEICI